MNPLTAAIAPQGWARSRALHTSGTTDGELLDLFTGQPVELDQATAAGPYATPEAVPVYLGPAAGDGCERLSAWWHPPAGNAASGVAVLLCSALGREDLSSHYALRVMAQQLATAGLASLRFDYPGCGDSGGTDDDPQALERWIRSIHTAADGLRQLSGASRLVLLGLRAGVLLGWQAALARSDVLGMVAWMPILSGRSYVRELRMLGASSQGVAAGADPAELFEAGGFAMSPTTRLAFQALDAQSEPKPRAARWLVLERDDLTDPQGIPQWVEQLRDSGAQVAHERLPGYAAMMLDPHHSQVPRDWCEATLDWVRLLISTEPVRAQPRSGLPPLPTTVELGQALVTQGVTEQALRLPAGRAQLHGVLSSPSGMPVGQRRSPVVLINAGATRHTGPGRLYTSLARQLAQEGHTVLRFDLAGLGDSPAHPDESPQRVYPRHAVEQVRAAAEFLCREGDGSPVRLIGLCAGGYHALQAALAMAQDGRPAHHPLDIAGVLAINPLVFGDPRQAQTLGTLPAYKAAGEMARYKAGLWSAQRWKKLLRGEINLLHPLRVVARQLVSRWRSALREAARRLGCPLSGDVGEQLVTIAAGGVEIGFLFSENDPGLALLRAEAGSRLNALQTAGAVTIAQVAEADHTFTRQVWRHQAMAQVSAWLQRAG
jgi:alpha-beta hydrolase superfamily lysophospholipase